MNQDDKTMILHMMRTIAERMAVCKQIQDEILILMDEIYDKTRGWE